MRELRAGALLLLLFFAGSAEAWSQVGGSAARDEPAILPGGPLDVLAFDTLDASPASFWGPAFLPTPEGLVAFLRNEESGDCELALFPSAMSRERAAHDVETCSSPGLVAYDEATNAAFLCHGTTAASPVLEARDVATGEAIWTIASGEAFDLLPDETNAYCFSAALDPTSREVIAPIMTCCSIRSAYLVSIDVDSGKILWTTSIPTGPAAGPIPALPAPQSMEAFESYHGVTLTTTGVVLSGYFSCGGVCEEGVIAWTDREGTFLGKERAASSEPLELGPGSYQSRTRGVSQYAVAQGPIAAAVIGDEIVLINPELETPVARAPIEAISPNTFATFIQKGHWHADTIVATLGTSLTAFDSSSLDQQWSWSQGLEFMMVDSIQAQSGDILAFLYRASDATTYLATIESGSGRTRSLLQLPIHVPDEERFGYDGHMTPVPGEGLLVADEVGQRVLVGSAPEAERPRVTIEPLYPIPGEEITLRAEGGGADVERYLVSWAGGDAVAIAPGESARHVFTDRADREVRVTAVRADGLSRTSLVTVHVGGTPPPRLTALQKAFSPEYQNWTFFLLGLAVTILGVGFTVGRQRRRFNKLERELAAVEEIRMLSVQDPRAAVLALKSYRDRLPGDLARRRIDDSQYQVLDIRSARLLKVLRTRMFSPFDARLSTRYHRLIDAAFEDAILQPSERDALIAALDTEEALHAGERERIAEILTDFTSARFDLH